MCSIYVACGVLQTPNLKYFIRGELRMKKNIIWGINIIVIIIIVFLVSCIFRNNANESNDIKTVKNTATVKKTVQDGNYSIGFYSYEKKIRNKTKKCWIPFVDFASLKTTDENLETTDEINKILFDSATKWMKYDFVSSVAKRERPVIRCHNERYLSIELSYCTYTNRSCEVCNYITIDLKRKKRIFLKDIVDKKTIIKKMKEGTDVYAKERAVLEENENERATLSLRQSLKKNTVTELEEMVDECSLDEGQFPFALDDKRRGLVNKSGFYIQGNILVIDDARMRQHSKIIIKNVIN